MFCPKCSQPQPSEQTRFCSRCGFPLGAVAKIVVHDGVLPETEAGRLSPRQNGIRQGVILLFVSLLVGFITALLSVFLIGSPSLFVPIMAGVVFLSGIFRISYAYIFEEGVKHELSGSKITQLGTTDHDPALPPVKSVLVPGLDTRRLNTSEMVDPPIVTEQTTKLLDNQ